MAPASLRYFGVTLADVELAGLRSDTALGRFVPVTDPLPVGTTVELDGVPHRVTRVEEGLTPGVWIWTDGAVMPVATPEITVPAKAQPSHVPDMATVRDLPTYPEEAAPAAVDAEATIATATDDAVPATTSAEKTADEGGRKRRRRTKTSSGH